MKLTLLFILTGLMVLSCKKEPRTERPLTTDSIIADTLRPDTTASVRTPDSIRVADSIAQLKRMDTAKAIKKKAIQK